ncbi:hypothetical protein KKB10_00475 [Patescibacteria group bacterium]|nr:hypothetical protein [Patescibacteria group bacterium]MBU1951956.1 hypothetical protein [Patescibacteria group bacterium]
MKSKTILFVRGGEDELASLALRKEWNIRFLPLIRGGLRWGPKIYDKDL